MGTPMLQVPRWISRYEIKTLIGTGGMGTVYLALDTNPITSRLVAVKLLNATLDSAELRERFAREASALAALNHPNIVHIHDSGELQGSPFFVMEYVRGETVAEKIKRKAPLSLGQKLKLMVELCSGLAHAHEARIIHRDIKPANLMVDQDGRLKILDFGIARVTEGTRFRNQLTLPDVRIGTPGYMSPEQIEGEEIDSRSDIFAVGAVCYELIAHREAFSGANTRQIENKVLEARPARLGSLVPDLDPAIEEIVHRALAKDPRDRFQDAAAFEEALEKQRWKLGREATPVPALRPTPTQVRDTPTRARDSRANAAYKRSLVLYDEGAVEAARRSVIEALALDPDHEDARAFIERLGADLWPPPPPPSRVDPAAPTELSTSSEEPITLRRKIAALWRRQGKTLQIAGVVAGVVAVVVLAILLAVSFWPRGPLLTVTRPTGGTVWTTGITCGTDASNCTANFAAGETVQLRAEPDSGYVFGGFTGDCTKNGLVHMTRPRTCVATFNPLPKEPDKVTWALTIVKPANGMIVGPGGLRCGSLDSACSVRYPEGTEVTLSGYGDQNFAFRGFTGDCSPTGGIVMNGARTCGATFVAEQKTARVASPPSPIGGGVPHVKGGSSPVGTLGPGIDSLPGNLPGGNSTDPLAPPPSPGDSARVAPPVSPDELAKKDIQKLIEEYRDAYERLDVKGIQKTYPDAPVSSLKSGFSGYNSLKYALEGTPEYDVDSSRGIGRVKAKFLLTPDVKVGSRVPPYRREETFKVERQPGGVWLIKDWTTKPIK